jgi:hypothetical protein
VPIRFGTGVVRLRRSLVSGGYFDLLGTRPLLGRTIRPQDDAIGAAAVAVLSYAGWQHFFGGDSGVIGRQLVLHWAGKPYTVVGVLPAGGAFAASFFIAESIYLGLTSYARRGDSDREWLARSSGWFVAMTVGWGALSALVLYAPDIHGYSAHIFWSLPAIGAAAGITAAGVGSSALTLASLVSSRFNVQTC